MSGMADIRSDSVGLAQQAQRIGPFYPAAHTLLDVLASDGAI